MKDYLGNEIKAGMTVRLIRTAPMFGDVSEHRPKKNGKGFFKPRIIFKQPKSCWQCEEEYTTYTNDANELMFKIDIGACNIVYPLSIFEIICSHSLNLITIKGLSDKEPQKA